MSEWHWVYRLFDESDALLYVGYSVEPIARFRAHHFTKPWWPQVVRVTTESFLTKRAGLAAEKTAIVAERPRHNQVRFEGKTPRRSIRIKPDLWAAVSKAAEKRGETVSDVARRAFEEYVEETESGDAAHRDAP